MQTLCLQMRISLLKSPRLYDHYNIRGLEHALTYEQASRTITVDIIIVFLLFVFLVP